MSTQRLELTWIGKNHPDYDIANIEPRILIEDPERSYGDPSSENMLIHGDNLLALKALLPEYEGRVKCIYIDPPYNTGNAFEHYDDSVEHSTWLSLMKPRLELLRALLSDDGVIYVQLDDNELDYCKILLDEIFGRKNFMNRISIEVRSPSAFSTVNPGVFKSSEYILWYAKNRDLFQENSLRIQRNPDYAYDKYLVNPSEDIRNWRFIPVYEAYKETNNKINQHPKKALEDFNKFIINNASQVCRLASISDSGAGAQIIELKNISQKSPGEIFLLKRGKGLDDVYVLNGQQLIFYKKNIAIIDGIEVASKILTNIWSDISWEGIANEGNVQFKKSKKPERLIKRCIELSSKPGDLILDSFLGSGTTAGVAHKMGRKWIGIEMGDHAYTHCKVRLDKVIDGEDQGGITKSVDWKGGGGYKFYELAPSFITTDEFGNRVIDEYYNDEKLVRAMCKLLGYTFRPSHDDYFRHGIGTGQNYLYVTTQMMSTALVRQIASHLGANESLVIATKKYEPGTESVDPRITIKKIPQSVLKACQYGKKEYLLPIRESAIEEIEDDAESEDEVTN